MEQLKKYFELQKEIYDYFGYVEDWVVIPLEDHTDCHWMIVGDERTGTCVFSHKQFDEDLISAGKEIYSGPIYTQRFLPTWVYRADDYTMVSVDTMTDGNKFLMVFDNSKECIDEDMKELYLQYW